MLWATRMVKNSITRAYGTSLKHAIVTGAQNRFAACFAGAVVTAFLQSSTATALIIISFIKSGFVPTATALAAIIGADISTTLVAQILTFDLSWLSPILITAGTVVYSFYSRGGRIRHLSRAAFGVGLLLLALALIREASVPLKESTVLPLILGPLDKEPVLAIFFAAIFTYCIHSSLATILLFATLAAHGIIPLHLALFLVLGANMGGAFIPFVATYKEGVKVHRITFGNIFMRAVTALSVMPFLPLLGSQLQNLDPDPARIIVNFHTGFNIALALVFLPLIGPLTKLMEKFFPDARDGKDESAPQYLDEKALNTPVVALAAAARETLRMAEVVEKMLGSTITAIEKDDEKLIDSIRHMDNTVDRLNQAIKIYLTRLSQESFDPKEADRYIQILTFATNLEHAGDIIDKSLLEIAEKKIRNHEKFSEKGFEEIREFHHGVLENLRLAQTIFLSEDPDLASQLVEKKKSVREAESETSREHFKRLRAGLAQSIATSSMHLDIIRDLRRINSHITSVAYAIAEHQEKHKKKRKKKAATIPPEINSTP
ncbi:MAG: Na/Pi cotransporter family protein [Alphaproteobacteria bacterium]|nr:Na/Pi cotransporter family protein [Alphaproteobacteria bacterium]